MAEPVPAGTGVTFADAAAEWLRYIEHDRGRKPSTVSGYRSIVGSELLPRFRQMPLETITPAAIESWQASMTRRRARERKVLVLMDGIFQRARKVWALPTNPVTDVEKPPVTRSGDLRVFSPEEVWALVRAAASEADGALYLTAAFTGLRMAELLALRWRDIDLRRQRNAGACELLRRQSHNPEVRQGAGGAGHPCPAGHRAALLRSRRCVAAVHDRRDWRLDPTRCSELACNASANDSG